jgi:protein involved in polysaccharide export with SLBB domain
MKAMIVAMLLVLLVSGGAAAQVVVEAGGPITAGDMLQMVVPGRPDLDRALVVNAAGSVEVPQVGEVRLIGLSIGEASVLLKQRLRLIAPTLDTVELTRAAVVSFRVYVLGQVGHPGAVEFKQLPSIWEVVRAAGGPVASADLRSARIIREVPGGQPVTLPVDLAGVMDGSSFPDVELRDGDTLVVPALAEGVSGVPSTRGVKVFGGVGVPSIVAVDGPTPLMDVLMRAGAPTAAANMKKVAWVHQVDGVDQARVINLRSYLEQGNPEGNPLIHPGDTVNVTLAKPGRIQSGLGFLIGTAASLAAVYIVINNAN